MSVNEEHRHGLGQTLPLSGWNRAGWRTRGGYLWYFAAIGAFTPYATLYYRGLGFSGLEVGVLAALPALAVALTGPLVGSVADTLAIHRLVLRAAMVLAALVALALTRVSAFGSVAVLVAMLALVQAPIASLLDGYAVTVAERLGRSYGSLRVWGSLGYTVAALTVGRLMGERVSHLALVGFAICLGFALLSVLGLPALGERTARPLLGGLGLLLRNRPLALLLLVAYLIATSAAMMYGFLGIHLQELGASANLVGVAVALGAASELPVVALGGRLLARLGPARMVALAIVAYGVRFVAYGAIGEPEWVLPVQTLHGLSYGAFLVASVTLAHRLGGREHAASAQALLAAVSFGFGTITGSLVGGALLDRVGTAGLFRGAAVVMVVTLVVFLIGARATGIGRREGEGGEVIGTPLKPKNSAGAS
ncbi:MAG: transporter, family, 3-phenylpropionic acid transporter [Thermomicrobiales bacterium]|nr:transporter, family, 3-phenylpropionic acid transporter [Thermomicrobiales bacterium]